MTSKFTNAGIYIAYRGNHRIKKHLKSDLSYVAKGALTYNVLCEE